MDVSEAAAGDDENVSITLMERGSHWPRRDDLIPSATFENIVMAQDATESTEAFAARATLRLAGVQASGHHLKSATLLVGRAPGNDSPIVHGRLAMAVGDLLPNEGKLTLIGDDDLSEEQRADLANVAAALSEYFGPRGPGVRLLLEQREDAFGANSN